MSITTDVRKTVLEQSKLALDEARKPWYAAVGVSDLAYDRFQKQLTQLPTEVQGQLRRLRENAAELDAARLREAAGGVADQAMEAYTSYTGQAKERYESLAHRGELIVRRLRRSPEVRGVFGKAEELISEAGQKVEEVDEKVTRPGRFKTAPHKTAPHKTAPHKNTPRSTTARTAPAKRPATKA